MICSIIRSNWCGWGGWERQELDTHTETKQRVEHPFVMVICEQSLKEGLETIALHVRRIYVLVCRLWGRRWVSLPRFTGLGHVGMWGLPKHIYLGSFPLLLGPKSTLCSEQGFPLRPNIFVSLSEGDNQHIQTIIEKSRLNYNCPDMWGLLLSPILSSKTFLPVTFIMF